MAAVLNLGFRAVASPVSVSSGDYLLTVWRTDDGLPQSSVYWLAQSDDGYLWLATRNGLGRFDGLRFDRFTPDNTPSMTFDRVRNLAADGSALWITARHGEILRKTDEGFQLAWKPASPEQNAVWFCGTVGGVSWYVLASGQLLRLPSDGPPSVSSGHELGGREAPHVAWGANGELWFINKDHWLGRQHGDQLDQLPHNIGLSGHVVSALCRSASGEIIAGTEREIATWTGKRFRPLYTVHQVSYLQPSRDGGVWAWTADGVQKFGPVAAEPASAEVNLPARAQSSAVTPWPKGLSRRQSIEDRDGHLWCATFGEGLWRISTNGDCLQLTSKKGLPGDRVYAVLEDREGNIWAGLDGGLARLRRRLFETPATPEAMEEKVATSVCPDRRGGVWLATYGAGLYHVQDGVVRPQPLPGPPTNVFIYSVLTDTHGRTWFGTRERKLFCFDGNDFSQQLPHANPSGPVRAIAEDTRHRVWFGSDQGAWLLVPGSNALSRVVEAADVRCFVEDAEGAEWLGTEGQGLLRWKEGKLTRFHKADGVPSEFIWSILTDGNHGLWLGTADSGLALWKPGEPTLRFRDVDGLPDNTICHLLEDQAGRLWGSTFHGIFQISKAALLASASRGHGQLPCIVYGRDDGLPAAECSGGVQPSGMTTADHRLWFPTVNGLATVLPRSTAADAPPLHPLYSEMTVDGNAFTNRARLPAGSARVAVRFTAPCLATADNVLFRYKLEGLSSVWTDVGRSREAVFDHLRPGPYEFVVSARNVSGLWSPPSAPLSFIILPFFWQTLGFKLVLILGAGLGLGFAVRWVSLRGMRRQLALAEQHAAVERERSRISRDMHDELGARLTKMSILSELAGRAIRQNAAQSPEVPAETNESAHAHLRNLSDLARQTSVSLSELIWTVKPENDSLPNLANYLCQCADEFFGQTDIRCRFEIPEQLPPIVASADVRQEISLAVKEALNNIAKHSGATEARLAIRVTPDGFMVVVTDNGRGLPSELYAGLESARQANRKHASSPPASDGRSPEASFCLPQPTTQAPTGPPSGGLGGNGLHNMCRRLERIGGRCEFKERAGGGLEVTLTIQLAGL